MIDIKKIRLKLGYYDQGKFANKLGLSQSYYSRLENSKRPLNDKIKYMLINNFQISEDYLNEKTDEPFSKKSKEENINLINNKNFISMINSVVSDKLKKEESESLNTPINYEKLDLKQKKLIDKIIALLVEDNSKS